MKKTTSRDPGSGGGTFRCQSQAPRWGPNMRGRAEGPFKSPGAIKQNDEASLDGWMNADSPKGYHLSGPGVNCRDRACATDGSEQSLGQAALACYKKWP